QKLEYRSYFSRVPSKGLAVRSVLGLIGWILVTFAAAGIGSVASVGAPEFYRELTQPAFAPPSWVFGPMWSLLYLLMAIAAWLVWREQGWGIALVLFGVQLIFNALWSWLFFAWQQGFWSFAEIVLLWVLIAATVREFWRVKPLA